MLGVMVRNFFMVKFPEFFGSTSYNSSSTGWLYVETTAREIKCLNLQLIFQQTLHC